MPSDRRVNLVWAQTTKGVIGKDGAIPWHIPEDMAHFKALTMGHPVIMGRKTWDSLPARFRPLSGRRNIVVTRQPDWTADGAEPVSSPARALDRSGTLWIMGGSELYSAAMPFADALHVTEIDADIDGDTYAPTIGPNWNHDNAPWHLSPGQNLRYRFLTYLPAR